MTHVCSRVHQCIITSYCIICVCVDARANTCASVYMYEANRTIVIRCKQATCYTNSLQYHNRYHHHLHLIIFITCIFFRILSLIPPFTSNDCFINSQSSHDSKIVWFLFHYLMNVWEMYCLDWTGKKLWFILEYDISNLIVSYVKMQGGANVPMKMSSWEFHNSGIICLNGLPSTTDISCKLCVLT